MRGWKKKQKTHHQAHSRNPQTCPGRKILAGADANLALGIKNSKPGRRVGTKTYDDEALAAAYWFLVRRGFPPEKANAALQEAMGADRSTIQRIARSAGHQAFAHPELIDDEILKVTKPSASRVTRYPLSATTRPNPYRRGR